MVVQKFPQTSPHLQATDGFLGYSQPSGGDYFYSTYNAHSDCHCSYPLGYDITESVSRSVQLIHLLTFSAPFYIVVVYAYCHGILGHSGVNFKSFWWQPWQPDTIFHDNHHQYFHVNFGFNIYYWDILHGTYRQKDRVYSENIFYGRGKKLDEVSEDVLQTDIIERNLENPQAYRNSIHRYKLNQKDLSGLVEDNKIKTN